MKLLRSAAMGSCVSKDVVCKRISLISFVAMWMVVLIHFYFIGGSKLSDLVTKGITQWAVPWFFIVSGVFARASLRKQKAFEFVQKKFVGLVCPYFAWCPVPAVAANIFASGTLSLREVLGIGSSFPKYNTVLWYLRSLIGFMLVVLVWHKALKNVRFGSVITAILFLVTVSLMARLGIDFRGTPTSQFYFIAGYLLSESVLDGKIPAFGSRFSVVLCAWVLAVVLRIAWFVLGLHGAIEILLRNACVASMIAAIWVSCDYFKFTQRILPDWTKATFFVYCCHAPILNALAPVLSPVINASFLSSTMAYLIYVIAAPLFFFCAAAGVKKILPRTYGFVSGGR